MRWRFLLIFLWPLTLLAQNEGITFSHLGGVYTNTFTLSLTCEHANYHIRYTTNGSTPTKHAQLYSGPIVMSRALQSSSDIYKIQISPDEDVFIPDSVLKAIVIRAAVFDENGQKVGPTITQSYFIESLGCDFHQLPIVSICADSMALFSYDTGIFVRGFHWDPSNPLNSGNYFQSGEEWERLCNIEYYSPNQLGFNQMAGIRTHGGNGRRTEQKAFKLYAREEYGNKNFSYKIFDNLDIVKYKRLVFKPFISAWTHAGIQDWIAENIALNLRMDALSTRPVIVFLNGEYWGIYFVEEKADERYLEAHHNVDKDDSNIIANWWEVENGNDYDFLSFYQWMENADLSDSLQYIYVTQKLDIPGTIDYMLLELFTANTDWPSNNLRCWQEDYGPWHWLFYDGDACFRKKEIDVYENITYVGTENWPTSNASTLFFRKLFQSDIFKKAFLARLIELNNSYFSYKQTGNYYREIYNILDPVVDRQGERFNIPSSRDFWEECMQRIDKFLKTRPEKFMDMTSNFFLFPEEEQFTNLSCSPNPIHGNEKLLIHFESNAYGIGDMDIYQLNGQPIHHANFFYFVGKNEIPVVTPLTAGVYIVKIGNATQKIVVL